MMRSRPAVLAIIALLLATSASLANPGGEGDADRDFTCGGSCHGDPALSAPSDGIAVSYTHLTLPTILLV